MKRNLERRLDALEDDGPKPVRGVVFGQLSPDARSRDRRRPGGSARQRRPREADEGVRG